MPVTSVGTPANTHSATGSVTGTWGTGQLRVTGNLLVAVVTCAASTSVTATATVSGWTNRIEEPNTSTAQVRAALWTKTAAGADAAPVFTSTETGTAGGMDCMLFELAGANLSTPIDTSGVYASGASAGTLAALSATTGANVTANGEYAIAAFAQEAAVAALTWVGNGTDTFGVVLNTNGATSVLQTYVGVQPEPPSGATLNVSGHFSTDTSAFGAGFAAVFAKAAIGTAAVFEGYANNAAGTVATGGTTAPSSGTSENWTVNVTGAFSVAANTGLQFRVADAALPSEKFLVIVAPGGTGASQSWTVIRGADGTTPVAHAANFSIVQVATAGSLGNFTQTFNVRSPQFGAKGDGVTDDTGAIQAALTACAVTGGVVYCPAGAYSISQTLQVSSYTAFTGDGIGITTIRAKNGYAATQVGSAYGMVMITTTGTTSQTHVAVRNMTLDGNQANIPTLPAYVTGASTQVECSPLNPWNCSNMTIDSIEIINPIGYAIFPWQCDHFTISNCRVYTGAEYVHGYEQEDAIHVSNCRFGVITSNNVDTGGLIIAGQNIGDDGICIQSTATATPSTDITICNNVIRGAARGVSVVLGGGPCSNIVIASNDVFSTYSEGVVLEVGVVSSGIISNVTINGNTFSQNGLSGTGRGITVDDYTNVSSSGAGWADLSINGNSFVNFSNTAGAGIYIGQGAGLQIMGNVFDQWNAGIGFQVGNNISAVSCPVTNFAISGNSINMTAATATQPIAIGIVDSSNGMISDNVLTGPGGSSSIAVSVNGISATNIPSGIVVTCNRMSGWYCPIDSQSNGSQPNNNTYTENNMVGCTAPSNAFGSTFGPGDVFRNSAPSPFLAATFTGASSASAQNVTGLAAGLQIGVYRFHGCFPYESAQAAGTATMAFTFSGTAGTVLIIWNEHTLASPYGSPPAPGTTITTASPATATLVATAGAWMEVMGTLQVTAAGTLQLQETQSIAADELKILAGSFLEITQIG